MFTFPRIAALLLGCALLAAQSPAHADDPQVQVAVDVGDVVMRNGYPYYRYGGFGYEDRLIVVSDRYGRPTYYRMAPRDQATQAAASARPSYGHYGERLRDDRYFSSERCDANGLCRVEYYDPQEGRHWYGERYRRQDAAAPE